MTRSLGIVMWVGLLVAGCGLIGDDAQSGSTALAPTDPTHEELPPLPEFSVSIQTSTINGNAPLGVDFEAVIDGDVDPAGLSYAWSLTGGATYDTRVFTHTFLFATTATVQVTATYRRGLEKVVRDSETIIRILGCADLALTQLSMAPPVDVAPGDTVTLKQGHLRNDGDGIETPFEIWFVLSEDDKLDLDKDHVVDSRLFESMGSGLFEDVIVDLAGSTFVVPEDTPDGNYYLFVVADPNEIVNECQESNNVAQSTNNLSVDAAVALKPDVAGSGVLFPEGLQVQQNQNINYSFTVSNEGEGEAGQFKLAMWLSDDTELSDDDRVVSGANSIGSKVQKMVAGASQNFFKSYKVPEDLPDGEYWLILHVDAENQLAEDSEDNNIAVSPWPLTMVYEEPTCFDLNLIGLEVAPTSTYWNGSISVKVDVENSGTVPVPAGAELRIYFSLNQTLNPAVSITMADIILPAIAPAQVLLIEEVVGIPSGLPVQPHYAGVILDPDAALTECSESNNAQLFSSPIEISSEASVDLVVEEVEFHPATVKAGQDLKVTSVVHNNGSSGATAYTLGIVFSPDPVINYSEIAQGDDLVVYQTVVAGLGGGGTDNRVDKVTVPLALPHTVGTYYVGVVADLGQIIGADSVKANNIALAITPVTVIEPQGGCFEDDLEPNDTLGSAHLLVSGNYEALGSCGDEDWFKVSVLAGQSLLVDLVSTAVLSLTPIGSDVDLELYDATGSLLGGSHNAGDTESVHAFTVEEDGTYMLRIFGKVPGVQARYDLKVDVKESVAGVDILPADVVGLPATLYPGGLMSVGWKDVNLGDEDAGPYAAQVWASKDSTLDELGDVLMGTLPVDGISAQTQQERYMEFLLPEDLDGGLWRFLVWLDPEGVVPDVDPENNVGVSDTVLLDAQLTCADDSWEPNNDPQIATEIDISSGAVSLSNLTVCPKLDDWYLVELETGASFSATAAYTYESNNGLVSVELWDSYHDALLLKHTGQNNSKVTLPWVWDGGSYYLRISVQTQAGDGEGAPYGYTLTVNSSAGDPLSQCDGDAFESNNAFQQASIIGCGLQAATLCKGDVDAYRVEIQEFETLSVELNHTQDQLKMALYGDPDGNPIATKSGNGTLTHYSEITTTMYLLVSAKTDPLGLNGFDYTLFMDGVSGKDLIVVSPETFLAEVYQGEDDLVDFTVNNTCVDDTSSFLTTIWLSHDTNLDEFDVDVATFEVPGVPGKSDVDVSQKISIPFSTAPGTYHLLVEADSSDVVQESNEGNNLAHVSIDVAKLCLPDNYEPNDLLAPQPPFAPVLTEPGATDMVLCPYEIDWYALDVPAGKALSVDLTFDQSEGDLDLRLYDPSYSTNLPVEVSATNGSGENATYQPPIGGLVLIRVNGFDGSSATYNLGLTLE